MKIVAFAGSISSTSINKKMVKYALNNFKNAEINLLDLNDFEMPIYSEDREKNGFPDKVYEFIKNIENADVVICSLAEHNRTYCTGYKNVLDWAFRANSKFFSDKPMLLMSTTTVENGSVNVLKTANTFFPLLGADVKCSFLLPDFNENFDLSKNEIKNEKLKNDFNKIIDEFKRIVNYN
ncbi:MAG: NAD(P)H-dependent oxidoreductase [Crocinitomicaceae bacterium]|nr:NAD(P)H-dependent oxidoreductase [Crocinitomicaceae bacterium]